MRPSTDASYLRLTAACFAGRTRASPTHAKQHVGQQNTRAVSDRPEGSESEFGRQIPVDLEADADLNEGLGVPGHWSSSLAFPCDSKVDRGGPLRKPHATERMHRRRLLSREFYCSRPAGLPVTCRAAYHCGGKAIRCPAAAVISLTHYSALGGLFVPLRGSSYGS
jgi:hypothetical protein